MSFRKALEQKLYGLQADVTIRYVFGEDGTATHLDCIYIRVSAGETSSPRALEMGGERGGLNYPLRDRHLFMKINPVPNSRI